MPHEPCYDCSDYMQHMGWGVDADMPDFFECIHNYIDHDSNIVRKGAISAKYGEKVLIPINMRVGVFSELAREMRIGTVLRRMELDGLCHE